MAKFYSVTLRMSLFAQQCINRWDYFVSGSAGGASAAELLTLMGFVPTGSPPVFASGTVAGDLQAVLSEDVEFVEVQVEELYTPTDFYVAAFSPALHGTYPANVLSITDAFGLFSNRVRTDIKRGFKRFPGIPSNAYAGGSEITGAFITPLTTLAEEMSGSLVGATAEYASAVFQFQEYTTPRGNRAYRKYADPAVQAEHVASPLSWTAYDTVRTQVSRQLGRGS